jgi:hypothetical protein
MKALLHKPKWIPKQRRRENDWGGDVDPEKVENGMEKWRMGEITYAKIV